MAKLMFASRGGAGRTRTDSGWTNRFGYHFADIDGGEGDLRSGRTTLTTSAPRSPQPQPAESAVHKDGVSCAVKRRPSFP